MDVECPRCQSDSDRPGLLCSVCVREQTQQRERDKRRGLYIKGKYVVNEPASKGWEDFGY